jgi:hypothetical protein
MKVRGRGRYYAVQRKLHKSAKDGPFLHKEHTAKNENDIFLIYGNSDGIDCKVIYERKTKFSSYMEIQMGSGAKSYMR